jgi:RimJ/RimL family protein N-acetyltransferase
MQTAAYGGQQKNRVLTMDRQNNTVQVKAHYTSADLDMHSLRSLGLDSPVVVAGREWITSMTSEEDGEDGISFWNWIEENHSTSSSVSIYDTFFFTEKYTKAIVATASIVPDDRGMGARYDIKGVWLGGLNVRQRFRGRGVGTLALKLLHELIRNATHRLERDIRVNLFTDNQIAMSMYAKAGYERLETLSIGPNKQATFFCKLFEYLSRTRDEVASFLCDLNARALTYHNHKETSAWSGLAFYYLLMFGWIVTLALHEPLFNNVALRYAGIIWLIFVTILVHFYIKDQLNLRSIFGDFTGACSRLSAKCIDMTLEEINALDFSLPYPRAADAQSKFSRFFAPVSFLRARAAEGQRQYAFPQFIKDEVDLFEKIPHQERKRLERANYLLLWLGAIVIGAIMYFGRDFPESPHPELNKLSIMPSDTEQFKQLIASLKDDISSLQNLKTEIADANAAIIDIREHMVSKSELESYFSGTARKLRDKNKNKYR